MAMNGDVTVYQAQPGEGALMQQVRGEMSMMIEMAHRYPRNADRSIQRAIQFACEDKDTAKECFYSLPRAGKRIAGPSIRLAEIVAGQWENLRITSRVSDVGQTHVTVDAFVVDLETNVGFHTQKTRRITNKDGMRFNDDMITQAINAGISIAVRDAIFRVVPRIYVNRIYEKARDVALDGATSMEDRRKKLVEYWEGKGVKKAKLLKHLGYKDEKSITIDDIDYLLGIDQGIKARDYDASDVFDTVRVSDLETLDGLTEKISKSDKPSDEEQPAETEAQETLV